MRNWAGLEESKLVKSKVRFLKVNTHVWNPTINCGLVHKPLGQEEAGASTHTQKKKLPTIPSFQHPGVPKASVWGLLKACGCYALLLLCSLVTRWFHEVPYPRWRCGAIGGIYGNPPGARSTCQVHNTQMLQATTKTNRGCEVSLVQMSARACQETELNLGQFSCSEGNSVCHLAPWAGCSTPRRIIPFPSLKVT